MPSKPSSASSAPSRSWPCCPGCRSSPGAAGLLRPAPPRCRVCGLVEEGRNNRDALRGAVVTAPRPVPTPLPPWTPADDAIMDRATRWYCAQDERAAVAWVGDHAFLRHIGQLPVEQWEFLLHAWRRTLGRRERARARRERVNAHPSARGRAAVPAPSAIRRQRSSATPAMNACGKPPAIRDGCANTCPTRRSSTS